MNHCPVSKTETTVPNDPAASELLKAAYTNTSRWGQEVRGFTATLVCNDDGVEYTGNVTLDLPETVEVTLSATSGTAPEPLLKWVNGQVGMMATHRASRPFEEADGKYAITFGPSDAHPLGRQLIIHGDGMNSRYRVKEGRIQQIHRDVGRMRFTINVEEAMTTSDRKFLTTKYTVFYFSPDGQVTQAQSFSDYPAEVKGVYLPGVRRIIFTENGQVAVRVLRFTNHQLR